MDYLKKIRSEKQNKTSLGVTYVHHTSFSSAFLINYYSHTGQLHCFSQVLGIDPYLQTDNMQWK